MNRIIRVKNANYTVISNVFVRDRRLSLKAKGLMALIMSLPDNWEFTIRGIIAIVKESRDAVYSAMVELKTYGYCEVIVLRDENNKILGNDYKFYEDASKEDVPLKDPFTAKPRTEKPHTENQTQTSTEATNDLPDKECKARKALDLSFVEEPFREVFQTWLDYKKEKSQMYKTQTSVKQCYKNLLQYAGNDPETARLIVEQSIGNNYAGLFPLKARKNEATATNSRAGQTAVTTDEQLISNTYDLINQARAREEVDDSF